MHLKLRSIKAIFLIINHAVASNFPVEVAPALLRGRARYNAGLQPLFSRQDVAGGGGSIWEILVACDGSASCGLCNGPNEIKDPNDCNKCTPCPSGKKPSPDKSKCVNEDGTCDQCTGKTINDPNDCDKCVECPAGKEPDTSNSKCIPDKKSRDEKDKRFNAHFKKRYAEYKEKAWKKWKDIKTKQYKDMVDRKKRLQVRRMSRCLAVVPFTFALAEMDEHTDLYDEAFMDHMNLAKFWPEDLEVDDWEDDKSDEFMESEEFADKWAKFGENLNSRDEDTVAGSAHSPAESNFVARDEATKDAIIMSARRDLILVEHEKRFLPFLIAIFAAAARTAIQVALRVAVREVAKRAVKIAKGVNKYSRADKLRGAKKIANSKHWRRCLEGKGPA